jgi:hypothetical protein
MANVPQNMPPANATLNSSGAPKMPQAYAQMLTQDPGWAMAEGSLFFEGRGSVQDTLRRIAKRLDELQIPYAIAGGLALFAHRYRRFTEDVGILVSPGGLRRIHDALDGRGYQRPFEKSKNLRDTQTNVKIEFLVSGKFPGDGKPQPISFPDPEKAVELFDGIKFLNLQTLVDLKLASGISGVGRSRDLADVEELIRAHALSEDYAESLDPYVRPKYLEIWRRMRAAPKRYFMIWREGPNVAEAAARLQQIQADGVAIDPQRATAAGDLYLVTTDRQVADKYGMEDESEFYDDQEEQSE